MKSTIAAALLISLATAGQAPAQPAEACRTVHGRMDLWNGAPTVRIWVIGTHRVLGVAQPNARLDDLPPAVLRIWQGDEADWRISILGDFKVCASAPARPGRMQPVRLIEARRLSARPRQAPQAGGGNGKPATRAANPSL